MKKETYLKYRAIFENNYKEQISKNKHDLGFVNLYDVKTGITRFAEFIYIYSYDKAGVLFSNTVSSIDKRKRFYVKNNKPVIKIYAPDDGAHIVDMWKEWFDSIISHYSLENKK